MADTSQQELSEPHTNGVIDGLTEEEKSKMRPADIDADMREMERRKRVEMMMNSRLFREELERIIETQMKDGSGPSGLLQQISEMMGPQGARFNANVFKNSNCVVPINDIRGVESMGYAKGEKLLRCKLAAVFRLLDLYGWTQGVGGQITARLNQDQEHFLVNPYGLLYHEVTASSLVKVDMQGAVVEQGTTNFGVQIAGFQLHSTIHAARPDIKCIVHIATPSVTAISSMKCGLLPLGQESIVIGEVSNHQYIGGVIEPEEREKISRNLGPVNKVMLLSNRGALCCGETVEEAFFNVYNTVLACETQIKLMPAGLDNMNLISEESKKAIFEASRKPLIPQPSSIAEPSPLAEKLEKRWRIGGTEFEALMRMLDNAGFRTGYIYRHPLIKSEPPRPRNDVEVPPAVSSLGYLLEEEELYKQGLWKGGRKGTDRTRWLNSPNVYQKVEILETGTPDPKKITKWVTDGSPTHSSTPVRIESALQFVPKNTNPKEFKQIQQQIKDYRRADKISAGPQSHILEGVSWEEAKKMQDATISGTGEQVVLVGAASKGIIQRGFQHNAMVYKTPYAKNPFDAVTDQELDQYKKDIERKQKGDPYDESQSESEALSSFNASRATHESSTAKSPIQSPVSVTSETEEESRDEPRVLRIATKQVPLPSQPEVVLSDDLSVEPKIVESPIVQQARIEAQRMPQISITQRITAADATTEFLNEMRRSAFEPRNNVNRRDYDQSSTCSSENEVNAYSSWQSPESYEKPQLEVARTTTVAEVMKPILMKIPIAPSPCPKLENNSQSDKNSFPFPKPRRYDILKRAFLEDYDRRILSPSSHSTVGKKNFVNVDAYTVPRVEEPNTVSAKSRIEHSRVFNSLAVEDKFLKNNNFSRNNNSQMNSEIQVFADWKNGNIFCEGVEPLRKIKSKKRTSLRNNEEEITNVNAEEKRNVINLNRTSSNKPRKRCVRKLNVQTKFLSRSAEDVNCEVYIVKGTKSQPLIRSARVDHSTNTDFVTIDLTKPDKKDKRFENKQVITVECSLNRRPEMNFTQKINIKLDDQIENDCEKDLLSSDSLSDPLQAPILVKEILKSTIEDGSKTVSINSDSKVQEAKLDQNQTEENKYLKKRVNDSFELQEEVEFIKYAIHRQVDYNGNESDENGNVWDKILKEDKQLCSSDKEKKVENVENVDDINSSHVKLESTEFINNLSEQNIEKKTKEVVNKESSEKIIEEVISEEENRKNIEDVNKKIFFKSNNKETEDKDNWKYENRANEDQMSLTNEIEETANIKSDLIENNSLNLEELFTADRNEISIESDLFEMNNFNLPEFFSIDKWEKKAEINEDSNSEILPDQDEIPKPLQIYSSDEILDIKHNTENESSRQVSIDKKETVTEDEINEEETEEEEILHVLQESPGLISEMISVPKTIGASDKDDSKLEYLSEQSHFAEIEDSSEKKILSNENKTLFRSKDDKKRPACKIFSNDSTDLNNINISVRETVIEAVSKKQKKEKTREVEDLFEMENLNFPEFFSIDKWEKKAEINEDSNSEILPDQDKVSKPLQIYSPDETLDIEDMENESSRQVLIDEIETLTEVKIDEEETEEEEILHVLQESPSLIAEIVSVPKTIGASEKDDSKLGYLSEQSHFAEIEDSSEKKILSNENKTLFRSKSEENNQFPSISDEISINQSEQNKITETKGDSKKEAFSNENEALIKSKSEENSPPQIVFDDTPINQALTDSNPIFEKKLNEVENKESPLVEAKNQNYSMAALAENKADSITESLEPNSKSENEEGSNEVISFNEENISDNVDKDTRVDDFINVKNKTSGDTIINFHEYKNDHLNEMSSSEGEKSCNTKDDENFNIKELFLRHEKKATTKVEDSFHEIFDIDFENIENPYEEVFSMYDKGFKTSIEEFEAFIDKIFSMKHDDLDVSDVVNKNFNRQDVDNSVDKDSLNEEISSEDEYNLRTAFLVKEKNISVHLVTEDIRKNVELISSTSSPKCVERRDSITEMINSININIPSSKTTYENLPETDNSLKYNLDATNMSLIYSLTPSADMNLENGVSSKNTSVEMLGLGSLEDLYNLDPINVGKYDLFDWLDLACERKQSNEVFYPEKVRHLIKSCANLYFFKDSLNEESFFGVENSSNSSNQGSDILELPSSTYLELKETEDESFRNELNTTVNQILVDLEKTEIYANATNLVDDILFDISCLTISIDLKNLKQEAKLLLQDRIQAFFIAKDIMRGLIEQLPCFNELEELISSVEKNFSDNKETQNDINFDDSVIIIEEIIHHIIDRANVEKPEAYGPKKLKETVNSELKKFPDGSKNDDQYLEENNLVGLLKNIHDDDILPCICSECLPKDNLESIEVKKDQESLKKILNFFNQNDSQVLTFDENDFEVLNNNSEDQESKLPDQDLEIIDQSLEEKLSDSENEDDEVINLKNKITKMFALDRKKIRNRELLPIKFKFVEPLYLNSGEEQSDSQDKTASESNSSRSIHSAESDNFAEQEVTSESTDNDTKSDNSKEKEFSKKYNPFLEESNRFEDDSNENQEFVELWESRENKIEETCKAQRLQDLEKSPSFINFSEVCNIEEEPCAFCMEVSINDNSSFKLPPIEEMAESEDLSNEVEAKSFNQTLTSPRSLDYVTCIDESESTAFLSLKSLPEKNESNNIDIDTTKEQIDKLEDPFEENDSDENELHNKTYTISDASDSDKGETLEFQYNADVSSNLETRKSASSFTEKMRINQNNDTTLNFADISASTMYSELEVSMLKKSTKWVNINKKNYYSLACDNLESSQEIESTDYVERENLDKYPIDLMAYSFDTKEFIKLEKDLETQESLTCCHSEHENSIRLLSSPPKYEDTSLCRVITQINLADTASLSPSSFKDNTCDDL